MNNNILLDEVYESVANVSHTLFDIWLNAILFSWRWWFGLALTVAPWIIWILFHDKQKSGRLLLVGIFSACTTNFLDVIGLSFGLWHYDWKLLPLIVSYIPWDYALFPVFVMFLLEIKPKVNSWIKAVVFSFTCAFVFEPIFIFLGMYHEISWKNYYSFIIYILLYYIYHLLYKAKFISDLK